MWNLALPRPLVIVLSKTLKGSGSRVVKFSPYHQIGSGFTLLREVRRRLKHPMVSAECMGWC